MASKLWIIGDSFWTRCFQRDTKTRLYNASWVDTFATECELDFDWNNSWTLSGASNDWNLYGLDCVMRNPQFNSDTDTILFGITTVDRWVTSGRADTQFEVDHGERNHIEQKIHISNRDTMLMLAESRSNDSDHEHLKQKILVAMTDKWEMPLLHSAMDYDIQNYDHAWHHWRHCNHIDNCVTNAKHRGVNIVLHRGCLNWGNMWTPETSSQLQDFVEPLTDPLYDWQNTELWDMPSFTLGITHHEDIYKYSNHMTPTGAKTYGKAFATWWNNR